jgi:hypothetical protein
MRFLDGALRLTSLGWAVFPISPGSKLPAIPKKLGGQGVLDATKDEALICEWARRFPSANVGVACGKTSGITVLDFDPKAGAMETISRFRGQKRLFNATVTARTPSGGWHLYYRYAPELLNSKSLLGPGIDVRTTGGYVVAPPSVLDGGRCYSWRLPPLGPDLAPMPTWAHMALKPKPQPVFKAKADHGEKAEVLARLTRFIENAQQGQRNSCLYWAARRAAEGGLIDEGARHALAAAAGAVGIGEQEAMRSIGSAFKAGRRLA